MVACECPRLTRQMRLQVGIRRKLGFDHCAEGAPASTELLRVLQPQLRQQPRDVLLRRAAAGLPPGRAAHCMY